MNVAQQEWIGELPSGWNIVSLRDVLIERKELNKLRQETNILSVTNDRGVINYRDKGNVGNKASDDIERYKRVYRGDIVANSMNVIIGSVGISPEDGVLSPVYIVMKPAGDVDTRFYDYIFKAKGFQTQLKRIGYGILDHRMRIPWDNLKIQQLPKPDYKTQQKIADFLDTETAQIDNLIAKQERLLELLEEKRRATITHAVTRSSGSKVALKMILEIPLTDGPHETPELVDDGIPFVSAEACSGGVVDFGKIRGYITREEHERFSKKTLPKKNDIFIIKSGATTGVVALVETNKEFNIWSPLALVRVDKSRAFYKFVYYALISKEFQYQIETNWSYGTQQNIGMGILKDLKLTLPDIAAQENIARQLDNGLEKIAELKQKTQTQIALLRERRTSLISHAVTGKVKIT